MSGVLDKLEERIVKRMDERMGPLRSEMQTMNKTLVEIRDTLKRIEENTKQ